MKTMVITYTVGGGGTAPSFPTASVTLTATNGVTVTNIQAATGSPAPGYLATCTSGGAAGGTYAVDGSGKFTFTPAASGAYGFRVTATNSAGTNSYTIAVNAKPVIPGVAITGQTADSLSGSVTGIESGATVTLKRYATSADASGNTSGTTVFSEVVNAASKAFTDSGLAGCSTYYYRAWQSHNSQNSDGTVTPVDGTTANVAAPVVTPVQGTTNLTFNWVDVTGATNYVLRVWKDFGGGGGGTVTNTDKFTVDETGATAESSTYYEWGDKTITGNAYYSGNNAGGSKGAPSIQFRSSNGSGIVATNSGGKIRRVSLAWGSTTTGRSLQVYGSHAAYTTATNLHNASTQGTLLGEITNSATAGLTTTNLDIAADWEFVGVRSRSGAMYLASVTFDWETSGGGGGSTTNYYGGSSGAAATSGVVVTGLKAQTEYCWSLTANGGTCSASATGTVSTAAGMDQAPSFAENAQVTGDVVVGETYGYTNAASGSPVPGLTASCSNPDAAGLFSVNNSGEFTFAPTLAGTYAFVVTATNQYGGSTHSASYTNTVTVHGGTPTVTAGAATSVTTNSARLPATVNAKGAETTMTFEWGTTDGSSYTGSVAVAGGDVAGHADHVGAAQTARDVYADLGGLIAGTTYYYKWTANNASGTNGTDTGSFTTECFGAGPVVTTNTGSLSATLSWPRMDGADHYLVSMWTGGGTGWAPVGGDTVTPGEYVIANSGTDGAIAGIMSSLDSGGYYTKENAELSDGVLSATVTDSEIWVLAYHTEPGTTNTWWTIQQKGGDYVTLAATSSNSGMGKTNDASVIDAKWNIWMSDGVVTVQSRRATTRYLKYNPTQPRFSSYLSTYAGHHLQLLKAGDPATGAVNGAASGEITDVVVAQPAAGVSPVSAVITSLAANTNAGYSWSVTAVGGGTCSAKTEGSGLKVEAAPAPVMDVSASGTLALGSVNVGGSATATFTVRNTGTAVLYVTNTISGAGFSVSPATFNLAARDGETVAQQTVTVTFAPGSTGAKTGTLTITSNDEKASGTATLNLTGTGTSPNIALECPAGTALASGGTLDFGDCPVWAGAVTQTVTIRNSGSGPLTVTAPSDPGSGFTIVDAWSGTTTVAAGGTATFGVKFTPGTGSSWEGAAAKTGTVTLVNDAGADYTFTVSATVPKPTLSTTIPDGAPTGMSTPVGTASAYKRVVVSGTNLRAAVAVSFTTSGDDDASGLEMCLTADGTYTSTLTIPQPANGTLAETTVYVRLKATAPVGTYHATLKFASTGAANKTRAVGGTVTALSDGLEFAGAWHMNPGDVWVKTNTTVRDMQFGSGDYYYTPAWNLTANKQFKAIWRENNTETWYGNGYWITGNRAGQVFTVNENSDNLTLYTSGGANPTGNGYYTLRGRKTGSAIEYVAMFTEAEPVEVTSVGDDSATQGTAVVTVRAGLSAAPSASEHVYLRYKVGSGSFTLAEMTGSGTNYSATITGQGKDTRVEYYVLTSPHEAVASYPDLCTLRGMRSGTTNFCYVTELLPPRNATATAGYEKVVLAWDKNAAGNNTMIVRYPGLTPEVVAPSDGTPYGNNAQVGDGAGRVVYVNGDTTGVTNTVGVTQGTGYTYVLYSVEGTGGASKYSAGVPVTATTLSLAQPTVSANASGTVTLGGANAGRGEIYVVARTTGSDGFAGTPSGALPTVGSTLCGGTVVYTNTTSTFGDSVIGCTTYYYQAWLKAADEDAWSAGRKTAGVEMSRPGTPTVTGVTTNTDGFALEWTEADRAGGYLISIWTGGETTTTNTDTLTVDSLDITATAYASGGFTNTLGSGAEYSGQVITVAARTYIQMRATNPGGIVTTESGGTAKKVTITGDRASGTVDIYGKATAYASGADLYSGSVATQGSLLGSITLSTSAQSVTITNSDAQYIGLRSRSGTVYITGIEIDWETTAEGTEYVSGYGAGGGWVTNGVAIGGMDPGTDYSYSLWAVGATTNCAGPVTTNLVHTDGTAKPNPPGLSLSATDAGTIAATVTRANGEAWELWRFATAELAAAATEPPAAESAGVVRLGGGATPASGSTTVTDTGLTGCTTYWYRAWEVNDPEGTPLWSNAREASATTPTVAAPTELAVVSTNAHGAELAWHAVAGATGYSVDVWHGGAWEAVTYMATSNGFTAEGTAPAGATISRTLEGNRWYNALDAGDVMTITLGGYDGKRITRVTLHVGSEADSGAAGFTVASGGATLASIPTSDFNTGNWYGAWTDEEIVDVSPALTPTVVGSGNSVTLTLTGDEDTVWFDGFTVEYEDAGVVHDVTGQAAATTNATVTGLAEGTEYSWRVAGVGGCTGAAAAGPDFVTEEVVLAPAIGSPLTVWVNSLGGTVTGSADADELMLKRFERADAAEVATPSSSMGGVRVTNVTGGAGTWSFADTNLLGCKTYYYRAWLRQDEDGETYWSQGSAVVSGKTDMATPAVQAVGAGMQIDFDWGLIAGATGYTVRVSSTNTFTEGTPGTFLSENFNTTKSPTGWSFSGTGWYDNAPLREGTNGSAIKFDGTGDYVTTPSFASGATLLKFWTYGNGGTGTFTVSGKVNNVWTKIEDVTASQNAESHQVSLPTGTTQLLFFFTKSSNCALDNVEVTGPDSSGTIVYRETLGASDHAAVAKPLELGKEYWYEVKAYGAEGCSTMYTNSATTANGPLIKVTPKHYDFGKVFKNDPGHTLSVTVKNDGNAPLVFTSVDLVQDGDAYSLTTEDAGGLDGNIAANGGIRTYTVTFLPQSAGTRTATLRFRSNGLNGDEVNGAMVPGLREVALTGWCNDPETADPTVYLMDVFDELGVEYTVTDHSLALEADKPVLEVTAYHKKGILTNLTGNAKSPTWTLVGADGNAVTVTNGGVATTFAGLPFAEVGAVTYANQPCTKFTTPIPALGAGNAVRGTYRVAVTVWDSTGTYQTTTTNCTPVATGWLFDDFTRADRIATGGGVLENGWTAMRSGSALVGEAAIHGEALELYGPYGASSAAAGRIAVGRNMGDIGYATNPHEFVGTGSWGFHFRTDADTVSLNDQSTAGAFVLGSTEGTWLSASAGQAGVAVMFTSNTARLAMFERSLLAGGTLTWLGEGAYAGTKGKTLAVRVDFLAGQDEVAADPDAGIEGHDAVPGKLRLYVREVAGTGGDPVEECVESNRVVEVDLPEALAMADMPYAGMFWNHGQKAAGYDAGCLFDDIHLPLMDGQEETMSFHAIDEDTAAPEFVDFDMPAAVAAGSAASSGVRVEGTIRDASGLWIDATGANAPGWETNAVSGPRWELWVDGTNVASQAITGFAEEEDENGESTEVSVSFLIPGGSFPGGDYLTTNCVVVVKAWDYDIDRAGDSLCGEGRYRLTLCAATPTEPEWATVEADGPEMAVLRWARTNSATYVVVRSETEIGPDAAPQGTTAEVSVGSVWPGWGTVVYKGEGDNHLTNSWTAREFVVKPGSSNYFAVYGMTGDGTTGHIFSSPTRPMAYGWTTTNESGATVAHWATEDGLPDGKPVQGSAWSNSWPCTTASYEPGEGVDAFAYRTSVSYPTNGIAETPATLALTYGYEARAGTGSGWSSNAPAGWQGDTNMWKIHDGSLLTGGTGYPAPTGNKLYWEDASGESPTKTEAKLTRMLDYPESGDFFVAAILNFQYDGTGKWVTLSLVDEDGHDLVSFGKQGGETDLSAAIMTSSETGPFGDHTETGGTPYTLTTGHGNDHIVVGQLSRTERKLRMWCYTGNTKIPEVYSRRTNNAEVVIGVATTALNTVRAELTYAADVTVPDVAGIRLCAGSDGNKSLGHVYFDEVRFAATWEELFLFNEPEVETFDLSVPAGSGKSDGTNDVGMTKWLVSDGALAHGNVGLNATFELYHRTGIQSARFDILSGAKEGQTNLLREVTGTNTTAAAGNRVTNVVLQGTSGSVYGEWTTPDGGAKNVAIPTNWISLDSNYVLQVSMHSSGGREATATGSKDNMGGGATDLFFGEYGEGASWDKYVEIYNGTGRDVDLHDYYIFRPANATVGGNQFTNTYSNLIPNATYPFARLSQSSFVLHHKQTVTLLNDVSQPGHPARLAALKAELDKKRAKYLVMPTNVLDSNGSIPYLLVKAEKFNESEVLTAASSGSRVNLDWLDACGCAQMVDPSVTERYIMSRKATATHLPRSNPMIIDTNEWDYRRWSYPKGTVDDKDTGYTNFVATAGGYDRAIGLGGTMEFRVYDDDTEPPVLAAGGHGGGVRLKGTGGSADSDYIASGAGERTYVIGGWSFTTWDPSWNPTNMTVAQAEAVAQMWDGGLTTNGSLSWAPVLGSITNVIEGGNKTGKGQSHVEFDGVEQRQYGDMLIKATAAFGKNDEVWLGFDLEVLQMAEPVLSFGFAGGNDGFSSARVEWSQTGDEGSFTAPDAWVFDPNTGGASTWRDWSGDLRAAGIPENAGHLWFRVVVKGYNAVNRGTFRMDNIRVEGSPYTVSVSDQDVAERGLVFEVRAKDASGVDVGPAGVATNTGAVFDTGMGLAMYRRAGGTAEVEETAGEATVTNTYTQIQWTAADGEVEKAGGFGKQAAQRWFTDSQAGKAQLSVEVGDLDDDRANDQLRVKSNFGMLMVYDDDEDEPQLRMTTMKPRLDGIVGEWLFYEKAPTATNTMDGVAVGTLGLFTTGGRTTQPRYSVVPKNESGASDQPGKDVPTYGVYQSGWQAGSKYWTTTLRTTGGGTGRVSRIHFWSKVGSVDSPTGWELWTKTGDADAVRVAAGSDTNGLLKAGGTTNSCWQKQSDEATEGLAIGVWRKYGIELDGASAIGLPTNGTPVEIRLLGKGAATNNMNSTWFLWDYTMEGELEQGTEGEEESYTYVSDHDLASGTNLTMRGSMWDEGSGLAAAPTYSLSWSGGSATGSVTFDSPDVALTNRTTRGLGAFSTALPVEMGYTALSLSEYKGTITATDADNDRNSADDGSGTNYDSLTHEGKFGFTVVDQDVTRPTAPGDVKVNGAGFKFESGKVWISNNVPGAAWVEFTRETAAWTNQPEFTASFAVAVDQVPTPEQWANSSWTNANVSGEVKKTSVQSGASGIGEYRVSLTTNAEEGVGFSVATTNGAVANGGFEETDAAKRVWALTDGEIVAVTNAVEGTHCLQVPNGTAGAGTNMPSKPQFQIFVFDNQSGAAPRIGGSLKYYLPEAAVSNGPEPRVRFIAFTDAAMTNRISTKTVILHDRKTAVTEAGWRTRTFDYDAGWSDATTTFDGGALGNSAQGPKINCVMMILFNTGAGKDCYFDDVQIGIRVGDGATGSMRYVATGADAQGLNAKYVFAVDGDKDRANDSLEGAMAPFYTAYDITPPTPVKIDPGEGASTEDLEDPTTQMLLNWDTRKVGPDNPSDSHYQSAWGGSNDVLSPWATYKVYYTPYDVDATTNLDTVAKMTNYMYETFLKPGAAGDSLGQGRYTGWSNAVATKAVADPTAPENPYAAMANRETGGVTLYDLENDQDYLFVVVGVDKAGNEGPATATSWATNNTIKFSITRGWRVPKAVATSTNAFGPSIESRLTNNVVAALEWTAAGMKQNTNTLAWEGSVKKDYDLIHWDARSFRESPDNDWKLIQTVRTNWFVDDGGPTNRGSIRFYRASYKDRWRKTVAVTNSAGVVTTNTQLPLVSDEVYAQTAVPLRAGQNFVALHGVPYTNTLRAVFGGTNEFPSERGDETWIYFYPPGETEAKIEDLTENCYWLDEYGMWHLSGDTSKVPLLDDEGNPILEGGAPVVAPTNWSNIPLESNLFTRSFSINLPDEIPDEYVVGTNYLQHAHGAPTPVPYMLWKPILQVPTNKFERAIECSTNGVPKYNIVALSLPVATHPSKMNLIESGFAPGDAWEADWIYTIDTITKEPNAMCYCEDGVNWYFVSGGSVPGDYFKPNDVLVIVSKNPPYGEKGNTNTTWKWTYNPTNFYTIPNRNMRP